MRKKSTALNIEYSFVQAFFWMGFCVCSVSYTHLFAGLKAVGESVAMPLEYYDNNLNSTVTLCRAMKEMCIRDSF